MTQFDTLSSLPADDRIPGYVHAQHRRVQTRTVAEMATVTEIDRPWIEETVRRGYVHPFAVFIPVDKGVTAEPTEDTRGRSYIVDRFE